jgi:hypothetical protein
LLQSLPQQQQQCHTCCELQHKGCDGYLAARIIIIISSSSSNVLVVWLLDVWADMFCV